MVVIGRNEGERLTRCLHSVAKLKQTMENVEVIYVDSNSEDGSVTRARTAGARGLVLPPGATTAARGRNAGWRSDSYDFVLFLDGDTVLQPQFLPLALETLRNPRIAVVWGHRRELSPPSSFYNRILDLDWIYPPGISEFCGGDALMRRDVLAEVGGYDETLIAGEEPEMCRRMRERGYQIMHIDCPMTMHDLAITSFRQYWKRALRAGFAYASVSQISSAAGAPLWRTESRRNLLHGAALLALPWLAAALVLMRKSFLPIPLMLLLVLLVLLRSARRAAWKCPAQPFTVFWYGVHSHFQQIPILFGQLKFYWGRRRVHSLIEYKEAAR